MEVFMILIAKKRNVSLIIVVFICSLLIYSLNIGRNNAIEVSGGIQKIILIDPGHGGEDPGAVSEFNQVKEKDVNLKIGLDLKKKLEDSGYKVMMTRESDKLNYSTDIRNIVKKRTDDLLNRKKMMDECGADLIVSIHLNKYGGTTKQRIHGAQVFYPPNDPSSQKLAEILQSSIKSNADPLNERVALEKKINGKPIIIFNNPKTTIAVVECGFLSDQEEGQLLIGEAYQGKLVYSIKQGIDIFFNPNAANSRQPIDVTLSPANSAKP
jgi:N-acetylmuramoyl-L-alanine amidase